MVAVSSKRLLNGAVFLAGGFWMVTAIPGGSPLFPGGFQAPFTDWFSGPPRSLNSKIPSGASNGHLGGGRV